MIVNILHFEGNKKILHFEYATQQDMNKTFMRLSEYLESPTLKGTVFEAKDVLDLFPNYCNHYLGHNIPGVKLNEFHIKYRKGLYEEETRLFKLLQYVVLKDCYIIATYKSNDGLNALEHEIAHAFYFLFPDYREKIDSALNNFNFSNSTKQMEDILKYKRYDESVWQDEKHAFLIELGLCYKSGYNINGRGFFYGYNFKRSLNQLFAGKIRSHFKYKKIGKFLAFIFLEEYEKKVVKSDVSYN